LPVSFHQQSGIRPVQIDDRCITQDQKPTTEDVSFDPKPITRQVDQQCRKDQDVQESQYQFDCGHFTFFSLHMVLKFIVVSGCCALIKITPVKIDGCC